MRRSVPIVGVCAVAVSLAFVPASPGVAVATPGKFKKCTAMHKRYPHGVGRVGARDKITSGSPVTTFKRSNRLYEFNSTLDRDKDKVACEKK